MRWWCCTSARCLFLVVLFLTPWEADRGSLALYKPSGTQNDDTATKSLLRHSVHGYTRHFICWFVWNLWSLDNRAQVARSSQRDCTLSLVNPAHYFWFPRQQENVLANVSHCLVWLTAPILSVG